MQKKQYFKLTTVMGAIIIVATFSIASYLITWAYLNSKNAIESEISKSLTSSRSLAEIALNSKLETIRKIAKSAAGDNLLAQSANKNTLEDFEEKLELVYENNDDPILDILFAYVDGHSIPIDVSSSLFDTEEILSRIEKETFFEDKYHFRNLQIGSKYISVLYYASPIVEPETGKVQGSVYSGMILNNNYEFLKAIKTITKARSVAIYSQGTIVGKIGEKIDSETIFQMLDSRSNIIFDEHNVYTYFSPSIKSNKKLVVILSFEESFSDVLKQDFMIAATKVAAFIILFLIISTLIISRFISRPLQRLTLYSRQEEDTNKSFSELDFGLIEEFHELGRALSNYTTELRDLNKNLEHKIDNRTKQLANKNQELQGHIQNLVNMQKRMVAQEKLASLGSLSAGIAHEIKNPLNLIINSAIIVSKASKSVTKYLGQDDVPQEKVERDMKMIEHMTEVIQSHSQRADNVIKTMLTQSRGAEAELVDTDLKHLIDENLKLAFHAMRAKNPFNITPKLQLEDIDKIKLFPQELGQVFINIFDNAFYALHKKVVSSDDDYQPELVVSLIKKDDFVIIKIKDNGTGIPEKSLEKIFEPFVTTKPTGEGTGLGLSISFDIISKHNGEISIDSLEGSHTEFTITLPTNLSKEQIQASNNEEKPVDASAS